jgi:hypothetical protein
MAVKRHCLYNEEGKWQRCKFGEPDRNKGEMVSRYSQEVKELVDESILPRHILTAHPPDLTFSQDVDRFITLDGPPCRLQLAESLLGVR